MIARTSIVTQLRLLGLIAAIGVVVVVGTEHALLRGARQRFDEEPTQLSVRRAREALTRTIAAERDQDPHLPVLLVFDVERIAAAVKGR